MIRDQNDWIQIYVSKGAYWEFKGENKDRPHAVTRAGEHTGGFFLSKLVIDEDPGLRRDAASDLVSKISAAGILFKINRVVGPATGATKLAQEMANQITARQRTIYSNATECLWASPVKTGDGADRKMVFTDTVVVPGESVLIVEDVITTFGSAKLTADAVRALGGNVLPFGCAVVNRSGQEMIGDTQILSLISRHLPTYQPGPETCPFCKMGSEAIPAKNPPENWARLSAEY